MFNSKSMIPSMEQRKSQINLLQAMQQEQKESKEFLFPDDSLLHRRRPSAPMTDHSATQSEDDDSYTFEVSGGRQNYFFNLFNFLSNLKSISLKISLVYSQKFVYPKHFCRHSVTYLKNQFLTCAIQFPLLYPSEIGQ